jgi:Restriction endonuclease
MRLKHKLSFNRLSDTDFEEFCYDLLEIMGFINLDWRKGTGKKSSPSDSGRDIVAHLHKTDIDRGRRTERWFVDCKHYQKGVPAKELHNLLAWAQAERPAVALFICSNFLSNPAKDYLEAYKRNNHPPFEIKYWERPTLENMTRNMSDFLQMPSEATFLERRSGTQGTPTSTLSKRSCGSRSFRAGLRMTFG